MTLFLRIKERFPARALEWFCGGLILALGWTMLLLPGSFDRPGLQNFVDLMPPISWAFSGLVLGCMHIAGLVLNGHQPKISIPLRLISAALGASFFGLFVGRFAETTTSGSVAFGVITYSALVLAQIYNTFRIAEDAKEQFSRR